MLLDFDESPVSQNLKTTSDNSDMEIVEINSDNEPTPRPTKKRSQTSDSDSEDGDVEQGENFQTPLALKRPKITSRSLDDSIPSDSEESEDGADNREGGKNRAMAVKGKDTHKQAKVTSCLQASSFNNVCLCATLGKCGRYREQFVSDCNQRASCHLPTMLRS